MAKSKVKIKADQETIWVAEHILKGLGLSLETAVEVFLRQVILCQGIPFRIGYQPAQAYIADEMEEMWGEYLYRQMYESGAASDAEE